MARYASLLALLATFSAGSLGGQEARVHLGAGPLYARPSGSFAWYVGDGYGAGGHVTLGGGGRRLAFRLDADYVRFAATTRARPYLAGRPAMIATGSTIFSATAGPRVHVTARRLRADVGAGAGFARLTTTGTVSLGSLPSLNGSTSFENLTYALAGDGGLGVCLRRGPAPLWLELSARYLRLGPSRWLREGNLPVGTVSGLYLKPTWSTSAQWVYRASLELGVGS